MKSSEFRIGNLVMGVNGLELEIGWEELRDLEQGFKEISPIPITEERLLNLGFSFNDSKSFSESLNTSFGNVKSYVIGNPSVWFCSHFDWMCHKQEIVSKRGWCVGRRNTRPGNGAWNYHESAEVYYIHQLQNLYYALRGEELKSKSNQS